MQCFTITHCITARSEQHSRATLSFTEAQEFQAISTIMTMYIHAIAVKQCVIVLHCIRAIGVAIGHRLSGTQ